MSAKLQCNPSSLAIICCVAKAAITLICYEWICGRNDPLLNSQINKPYLWLYSFYSWTKCCHILELTRTVTDHILWRSLHSVSLCLLLALFRLQVWKHPTCIASHGQCVDCRQDTLMEHCSNHIFIMPDGLVVQATCSLLVASPAVIQMKPVQRPGCCVMISPLRPDAAILPRHNNQSDSYHPCSWAEHWALSRPGVNWETLFDCQFNKGPHHCLPACIEYLSNPNIIVVDQNSLVEAARCFSPYLVWCDDEDWCDMTFTFST